FPADSHRKFSKTRCARLPPRQQPADLLRAPAIILVAARTGAPRPNASSNRSARAIIGRMRQWQTRSPLEKTSASRRPFALQDESAYCTLIVPCISAEWPGKLQKNTYGPPFLILLIGKLTDAVSPPPINLVCAMIRESSAFT